MLSSKKKKLLNSCSPHSDLWKNLNKIYYFVLGWLIYSADNNSVRALRIQELLFYDFGMWA